MGTEPQCLRFVTSMTDETAYGTATVDGSMTTMFSLVDPVLADENRDIIDDTDLLKGHEFRLDANAYQLLFTDRTLPMSNIPLSAEFLAWAFARALGDTTSAEIATDSDYTHTSILMDRCADGRQLPSSTIGICFSGSSAVNKKYKGCVIDSLTVRVDGKGRVTGDVTFITDGSEGAGSGISIPASFHSTSFYFGKDTDALEADYGSGLTTFAGTFRGFEMTINNNLDVDEAKNTNFQQTTTLPKLLYGTREITASIDVLGDETHALYVDAAAETMKVMQIQLLGPTLNVNDADCTITFPRCILRVTGKRYDGNERVFSLGLDLFYDATETSPIKIETVTTDAAVQ